MSHVSRAYFLPKWESKMESLNINPTPLVPVRNSFLSLSLFERTNEPTPPLGRRLWKKPRKECSRRRRRRRRREAALFSPPRPPRPPQSRREAVLGRRTHGTLPEDAFLVAASGVLRHHRRHLRDARGRDPPEKTEEKKKTMIMMMERKRTFLASRRRDGERWAVCSAPGR